MLSDGSLAASVDLLIGSSTRSICMCVRVTCPHVCVCTFATVAAHTTVIENGIDEQEGLVWSATSASAPQSTEAKTLSSMNRTA